MAKDFFIEKFGQEILYYQEKHEHEFIEGMKAIGKAIGDSISDREYEFSFYREKEFSKALEACKNYELNCDAVYNLRKHVFEGKNSSVNTIDCPKWESFKTEIGDYLDELPERGFVYIAWQANPLAIHYIGMTENFDGGARLNLRNHGLLSRAIEKGTTQFTIIFPDRSDNIKSVEGSFIRIAKGLGYEILNKKYEDFYNYDGELHDLEKFIGKVGAYLAN